jgi:hypothetical protein
MDATSLRIGAANYAMTHPLLQWIHVWLRGGWDFNCDSRMFTYIQHYPVNIAPAGRALSGWPNPYAHSISPHLIIVNEENRNQVFSEFAEESSRTGRLDFVASWYAKAISTIKDLETKCAFVSTNSICQGEQARTLGPFFANTEFEIDFAYPTFSWTSDSRNAAAVHVVIIGFSKVIKADRNKII